MRPLQIMHMITTVKPCLSQYTICIGGSQEEEDIDPQGERPPLPTLRPFTDVKPLCSCSCKQVT